MSRTFDVIDGKLRLTDSDVRVWYTAEQLRRVISNLEADLDEWRRRLAMLEFASNGCQCDLQDTPNAPADWHGKECPCYRPTPPSQ